MVGKPFQIGSVKARFDTMESIRIGNRHRDDSVKLHLEVIGQFLETAL
jgi:hypothetical protein